MEIFSINQCTINYFFFILILNLFADFFKFFKFRLLIKILENLLKMFVIFITETNH